MHSHGKKNTFKLPTSLVCHGLWTPKEGINQRNLNFWANVLQPWELIFRRASVVREYAYVFTSRLYNTKFTR